MKWSRTKRGRWLKRVGRKVAPVRAAATPYIAGVGTAVAAGVATYYGGAAAGAAVTAAGATVGYYKGSYWGATAARAEGEKGADARAAGRDVGRTSAMAAGIGGAVGTLSVYAYQGYSTGQWGVWGSQQGQADAATAAQQEAYAAVLAEGGTDEAAGAAAEAALAENTTAGFTTEQITSGIGKVAEAGIKYYQNQQVPEIEAPAPGGLEFAPPEPAGAAGGGGGPGDPDPEDLAGPGRKLAGAGTGARDGKTALTLAALALVFLSR